MTYDDLQFSANITRQTVARVRDHRITSCTLATLERIAKALNVHVVCLFDYTP